MKQEEMNLADIAASFQAAVVDVLVAHTILAAKNYGLHQVAIAGGQSLFFAFVLLLN